MTLNEALKWIADLFEEPVEKVLSQTKREDIAGWDSLGTLTLMAKLDEEFNIILSEEKIAELKVVEDILQILRENGHLE